MVRPVTSLRDDRYAAARAWHRRLAEDFGTFAPGFLDALAVIDAKHQPGEPVAVKRADSLPSDAELTAWIDAHPDEFAAWVRKRDRIEGGTPGETTGARTAAAASTSTARRRTKT